MKYAPFVPPDAPREPKLGAVLGEAVIDLHAAQSWAQGARGLPPERLPNSVFELIHAGQPAWLYARNLVNVLDGVDPTTVKGARKSRVGWPLNEVALFPPLPRPLSLGDFFS